MMILNFLNFLKNNLKKYRFYLFFIIIDLLFFLPVLINRKIIGSVDAYNQFYPYLLHLHDGLKQFTIPLWWQYTALGYPFAGVVQSGVFYPINYLYFFIHPLYGYNLVLLLHFLFLQIVTFHYFDYLLKKYFSNKSELAFLGSIMFSFSLFVLVRLDIYPFILSMPYSILSLLIIEKMKDEKDKSLFYILSLALTFGLLFLCGYPQLFAYTLLYIFIYIVHLFIKEKINKEKNEHSLILLKNLIISIILTLPIISIQLISTLPLLDQSLRKYTKDFFFNQHSYPPEMLITMILPYVFGGMGKIDYFGPDNEFVVLAREYVNFISLISIPTFLIGIYRIIKYKYKEYNFLILILLIFLLLSFGKYTLVSYLLYFVPFLSDLRVPARNMFFVDLSLIFISLIGIDCFLRLLRYKTGIFNRLKIFTKLFLIPPFVLFFIIFTFSNLKTEIIDTIIKETILGSFFLIILSLFSIAFLFQKIKKYQVLIIFIAILVVVEKTFLFFSQHYLNLSIGNIAIKNKESLLRGSNQENIEYNYFIDSFSIINLISKNENTRIINIYDPFVSRDYFYIFNIDWGNRLSLPFLYGLIQNNLILSTFGVNRIVLTEENINKVIQNIYYTNFKRFSIKQENIKTKTNPDNSIEIKFNNTQNSNLFILEYEILKQQNKTNIFKKIKKLILEKNNILQINVNNQYSILRFIEHLINKKVIENTKKFSNISQSQEIVDYITIPFFGKDKEITILINPNLEEGITIKNIKIYSYPPNKIPNLYLNKSSKVYEITKDNVYNIALQDLDIYKNNNSCPIVYSIKNVKIVKNIEELKKILLLWEINLLNTVCIEENELEKIKKEYQFLDEIEKIEFNKVEIENIEFFNRPDQISFTAKVKDKGIVVINDSFFDGWKCFANGKKMPVIKANGLVKCIILKNGINKVILKFEPPYKKFLFLPFLFILIYTVELLILIRNSNFIN